MPYSQPVICTVRTSRQKVLVEIYVSKVHFLVPPLRRIAMLSHIVHMPAIKPEQFVETKRGSYCFHKFSRFKFSRKLHCISRMADKENAFFFCRHFFILMQLMFYCTEQFTDGRTPWKILIERNSLSKYISATSLMSPLIRIHTVVSS